MRKIVLDAARAFDKLETIVYSVGTHMTDFATLSAIVPSGEGRFTIDVPDGWQQGRGAFGGYSVACLIRAIETVEPNGDRPLRNVNAELCAPLLVGPAEIRVEVLRRGGGMTTVTARTIQAGEVVAHATALLGKSRDGEAYDGLSAPDLKVPGTLLPQEGPWPRFTKFFEYRNVGAFPFTGNREARVETWVRMREPGQTFDAAHVAALADATWPAMFPTQTMLRPMSTISFTLQTFGPWDGMRTDAPIYHRANVFWSRNGHAAEMREIWSEDGRLLAINQQLFATTK
jgi:acyl-CoA thioesterase